MYINKSSKVTLICAAASLDGAAESVGALWKHEPLLGAPWLSVQQKALEPLAPMDLQKETHLT